LRLLRQNRPGLAAALPNKAVAASRRPSDAAMWGDAPAAGHALPCERIAWGDALFTNKCVVRFHSEPYLGWDWRRSPFISGCATLQASDSSDVAPMSRKTTENFHQFLGPAAPKRGAPWRACHHSHLARRSEPPTGRLPRVTTRPTRSRCW